MSSSRSKIILLKGIPIAALLLYAALTLLALSLTERGAHPLLWGLPFGYGLLALIAGEPIRKRIGVTHKWLAAYTRSLGALYATTAFLIAIFR